MSLTETISTIIDHPESKQCRKRIPCVRAYLRVSTPGQLLGDSLKIQRSQIEEFATKKGMPIEVYDEKSASGSSMEKRPQLRKLLNEIRRGDISVTRDSSRLSRNMDDDEFIHQWVSSKGATITTISLETPNGAERQNRGHINSVLERFEQDVRRKQLEELKAEGRLKEPAKIIPKGNIEEIRPLNLLQKTLEGMARWLIENNIREDTEIPDHLLSKFRTNFQDPTACASGLLRNSKIKEGFIYFEPDFCNSEWEFALGDDGKIYFDWN